MKNKDEKISSSLDSAAEKACLSGEKYVASRQEVLRSSNDLKKEKTVGKKTKKSLNRSSSFLESTLRSMVLCTAKIDVHD
ncbi:hypothetical protein TIFTF001_002539 [Ficus carica]|uniref:Uncharacterized protein n=1 Tax=Ficus carica TaxID=3494 RepID=A0AA88D808_FICCA|nr:hypothetical protein TIFTF001_002539 [Ficus carica]